MDQKVKLSILGISFSQVQAGAYALIFAESDGPRRLPIVIGTPEAQSIAIVMEKIKPPRPLSHDLMVSTFTALNIELLDVYIHKFENGAFYAELTLQQGENQYKIDSRTSDGVALAIRTGATIHTTEEIMRDMSVIFDNEDDEHTEIKEFISDDDKNLSHLSTETINSLLEEALSKEDFETAIILRDELSKRKE
ncbi:MAG TPA: bifunctional nuclease family protein [Dysgonamonadaceae bacterium]|nr:bifunctional nuclease family protein [Dysgonamonadaceae bacterium]